MSHHSHQFLRKMLGAVPGDSREDLSEIWGEEFWSSKKENTSKAMNSAQGMEKSDVMEFETLGTVWKTGDCLENAETMLVTTSPRDPDRRSHGSDEIVTSEG